MWQEFVFFSSVCPLKSLPHNFYKKVLRPGVWVSNVYLLTYVQCVNVIKLQYRAVNTCSFVMSFCPFVEMIVIQYQGA